MDYDAFGTAIGVMVIGAFLVGAGIVGLLWWWLG